MINLTAVDASIRSGHLKMGGRDPGGREISANSRHLTLDGQPWLPVMGEIHFSRYPCAGWEDALLKMKAGGITVVAAYLFWLHHEEVEGCFEWGGDRDVRRFIELCARHGLWAYPRLGPWAHGEARNGGFPDWLSAKCGREVRRDAEPYLACVRRYYGEIAAQLRGLLWRDGGPIIGIQLENELAADPGHIVTLKRMAREAALDVPLYTMTGWGPAQVPEDEVIPVFGGYPDAPWDRHVDEWSRSARRGYFFSDLRDDSRIGADLRQPGGLGGLSDLSRYPYGTCETGGGVQVTYHRRPFIAPDDVVALAYAKLGCGSNLQGYYMYHGGSHPLGRFSATHESQATGYPNDVPTISYDFQAPLGVPISVTPSARSMRMRWSLSAIVSATAPVGLVFSSSST
ncbi:MAG: beta-galactosidase, partial [Planctomycetota bacterium]